MLCRGSRFNCLYYPGCSTASMDKWKLAIVIARSLWLLSSKNFNVDHYSKSIKCINIKLGILAHDKMQLQDKGHKSESYSFGVMLIFNLKFK